MISRLMLLVTAIGFLGAAIVPVRAEGDPAALTAAMKNATANAAGLLSSARAVAPTALQRPIAATTSLNGTARDLIVRSSLGT